MTAGAVSAIYISGGTFLFRQVGHFYSAVYNPNIAADLRERARAASLQAATRAVTGNFNSSLEMKENVDFLLTPALLMQEAVSDDLIITYPSE